MTGDRDERPEGDDSARSRTRRVTLLGVVVAALLAVALGGLYALELLAPPTALRSGFLLLAAVAGLAAFLATRGGTSVAVTPLLGAAETSKLVVALGALAVGASAWTGSRLFPLLAFLPVGYLLVGVQLRGDPPAGPTLLSLATLFAVPALSKYYTTGFYFAGTDVFAHVDGVNRLLTADYTTAIPHGYDFFPLFHLLVGAVSLFGDLAPYHAILLTGISVYVLLVPASYLLGLRVFDERRTALATAAGFTLLALAARHALYFFPQALALALVVVAAYAAASLPSAFDARRLRGLAAYTAGMAWVLVLTHHLAYVILLGPLGLVLALAVVRPRVAGLLGWSSLRSAAERRPRLRFRWLFPAAFGVLALVTYLVFSPSLILFGILGYGYQLTGRVVTDVGPDTFLFGVSVAADSIDRAAVWLRTPTGLYYTLLGSVLVVGLYEFLDGIEGYARRAALLAGSTLVAAVLLPLPVSIPQIDRVQFVATLFALFPVGLGVARLLRPTPRHRRLGVVFLLLFAALGAVTPLTGLAGDDLDGVHLDDRRAQVEMTDDEYADAVRTARFLRADARGRVATDFVTRRAFESAVERPPGGPLRVDEAGLSAPPGYVVVRDRWTDHFTAVSVSETELGDEVRWFATDEGRLRAGVATHDKVYATDSTVVLRSRQPFRGLLGNASTAD